MRSRFFCFLLFLSGIITLHATPYAVSGIKTHHYPAKKDSAKTYTLYFSIDDGPLEGTPFIDSVFREEKVPADLFLVGTHANISRVFKGYLNELRNNHWFELNNHSYTHANEDYEYYYKHPRKVLRDMRRNNDSLHFTTNLCRMPARNMWRVEDKRFNDGFSGDKTADLLKRKGYIVVGWDLEWESDSLNRPIQSPQLLFHQLQLAFKNNDSFLPGNVVLLCHDWMFTKSIYKKEMQEFIQLVKASGNIQFEWLTNYPGIRKKNGI